MYLWSIDIEAVLTAMSCFRLLCEEAEIRCGADELTVIQILPNYAIYSELASASSVLTTGKLKLYITAAKCYTNIIFLSSICNDEGMNCCGMI